MILPKKHIKISDSIIGISSLLINLLEKEVTVDDLFSSLVKDKRLSKNLSLDTVILCIDYLYCQGIVEISSNGGISRCY
jgi:hypothetical protein